VTKKTISESITIGRSREDVWDTITTPATWRRWYQEDDLIAVIPDWQAGGVMRFASGSRPVIKEIVPPALLRWGNTHIRLTVLESSRTEVDYGCVAEGMLVEDPMLWVTFQSRYLDAVAGVLGRLKGVMEDENRDRTL
jgi:uncharacterized protein YndB with AHSA1/START domain